MSVTARSIISRRVYKDHLWEGDLQPCVVYVLVWHPFTTQKQR